MLEEDKKRDEKIIKMTTEPVEKLIGKLAVPTIISMLITTFYNMADTYFVGKMDNTSATGAIGVVFSLMTVIQAIGFFFGHGSGNYISRKLGAGDIDEAKNMASTGFFLSMLAGAIITVTGLIFIKPIAKGLGSTDTIFPYAVRYMRIILCGAPFMCSSLVLNNQLRFQGNAFYAMIGITSGALLNLILDPVLIFVFNMGVEGAACATVISQFFSACLLWAGSRKSDNLKIHLKNFKPSKRIFMEISRGGIPSLCRQGLGSVATVCLNNMMRGYGDAAIAAMAIVSRIMMFASSALIGFGQGFQPVCGFNYGAKKYKRVLKAFWFCIKVSTVFLVAVAVPAFIFAPNICGLFQKNDAEVLRIGSVALRCQLCTFPFMSWVVFSNMMMQTIGRVVPASFLAMSRQALFFIPAILILPNLFGLWGIIMAQPVADAVSLMFAIPIQGMVLKEFSSKEE